MLERDDGYDIFAEALSKHRLYLVGGIADRLRAGRSGIRSFFRFICTCIVCFSVLWRIRDTV